jgi:hypothetical protein
MLSRIYKMKNVFSGKHQSRKISVEEGQVLSDIKKLKKAIEQSSGEIRIKAAKDLDQLCKKAGNREILCQNEEIFFSLLLFLKQLSEAIKNDDNFLVWIVSCIRWLSASDVSCKAAISSKELALLPVLMQILRSSSDESVIDRIEIAIGNCSNYEGCHDYLLSSEIGWLDHIEKRLKEQPNDMYSYCWFVSMVVNMRNENFMFLINCKIPDFILQKMFSYGSNEKEWLGEASEVMGQIIRFVMYFSKVINGSQYLNDYFNLHPEFSSFFLELLPSHR